MSVINTMIHVKDSSGVMHDVLPKTTIKNVSGLQTALDGKVDSVTGKGLSSNDYTTTEKSKLSGIANNANNYVHPTTSGNKHIPSGGSSGQFLKWSSDGTAAWSADNNTTYTFGTGDSWGQIKVTPSGGSAQNVSVNNTITELTSGSVNNVTKSCTLRFGRLCTDLPQDGAVWLVDTKLSDENTGYQTAVALTINTVDGNLVGKMYVRIKASGEWTNWRLLTNT